MKNIINKILNIFKKKDYIPEDLGAKFYGPMEADPKDFKTDQVLGNPTTEELAKVPEEYNILTKAGDKLIPVNQSCVPSCFHGDMYVQTNIGYKKISNIKEGDLVYTDLGYKPVNKKINNPIKDLIKIKVKKIRGNKSTIITTKSHNFFVDDNGKIIEKQAGELKVGDNLLYKLPEITIKDVDKIDLFDYIDSKYIYNYDDKYIYGYTYSNNKDGSIKKINRYVNLDNQFLELLGFYIAEGTVTQSDGLTTGLVFTFHRKEKEYHYFVFNAIKNIFGNNVSGTIINSDKRKNTTKIEIYNTLIGEIFKSMCGKLSYYKYIPDVVQHLPFDKYIYLLNGLIKGDGYLSYKKQKDGKITTHNTKYNNTELTKEIGISITANRVMLQVRDRLLLAGYNISEEIRNNTTVGQVRQDTFGIYLYSNDAIRFLKGEFNNRQGYIKRQIKQIELYEDQYKYENVYDLEVDDAHHYYVQGVKVHNCTMSSLTNYITLQEVIEQNLQYEIAGQKGAELNREKMGHKWICKGERGDYLEHALKITKDNGLLAEFKNYGLKDNYIKIDNYSFYNARKDLIKYWISKGYPMYYAFSGNRNTWIEISRGEIKTINFTATGGHCVTAVGYDKDYLYFINTWRPNDGAQYTGDYSVFKISWINLDNMLKYQLANWRGWIVNVEKNSLSNNKKQMFKDYIINEKTEAGQAVKFLIDNKIINGIDKEDGKYLEPNVPLTRLQMCLIIYRVIKVFIKQP